MSGGFFTEVLQANEERIEREMKDAIAKFAAEAAKECADVARQLVSVRTGKLKGTIKAHEDGSVTAAGAEAWYGFIVEFTQPYLRPAFDAGRDRFEQRCKEV